MRLLLTLVTISAPILARNLFTDDDYFTELTSDDRQAPELSLDFPQLDEGFETPALRRRERDGGNHGGHNRGRAGRGGFNQRQGGNRRQQGGRRQGRGQNFEEPDFVDEERQGRQSGDVGVALGVLNNPPREDGAYNFK